MNPIRLVIPALLPALLIPHSVSAQSSWFASLGLTGDENGSIGSFGTLNLGFDSGNWISAYAAVNRPDGGFEDSRSLSASLDFGKDFADWSVSAGAGIGDRDGFSSRQIRANLDWQPHNWWLGGMVEHASVDSSIDVNGPRTRIRVADDFTVTGAGIRTGYFADQGLSFAMSWMEYNEPSGSRLDSADLLTRRVINSELQRLQADGRIDRLRLQNRLDQLPTGAYSNSTSVLSDSFSFSVGYSGTFHQVGLDYYHDTTALFDSELDSYSIRWMFPVTSGGTWGELWTGVSESLDVQTVFAGFRILFGN